MSVSIIDAAVIKYPFRENIADIILKGLL